MQNSKKMVNNNNKKTLALRNKKKQANLILKDEIVKKDIDLRNFLKEKRYK